MTRIIQILFVVLLLGTSVALAQNVPFDLIASHFTFEKDLKIGDKSYPDVNYLQYFLNQDPNTKVSENGWGSSSETSSYFGGLTKDAVRRFQEIYMAEVLKTNGLAAGTGYFGPLTRMKANKILEKMRKSVPANTVSKNVTDKQSQSEKPYPKSFDDFDKYIWNRVADKVSSQLSGVTNAAVKNIIENDILTTLKSAIINAKTQSENINNPKSLSFVGVVKKIFGNFYAFAENINVTEMNVVAQSGTSETPWGGMYLFNIQCTCGPESLSYILDYKSNRVLALLFEPGQSRLFSNYNQYGRYQLGTYMTATRQCQIYAGEDCVDVYTDGVYGMMPGTGTSTYIPQSKDICLLKS